jgi:hypothetical protein
MRASAARNQLGRRGRLTVEDTAKSRIVTVLTARGFGE